MMDIAYTITTTKSEFSLVRGAFADIGLSICLPDFLEDLSEEEFNQTFSTSEGPIVAKANRMEYNLGLVMGAADTETQEEMDETAFVQELFVAQHKAISRLTPGYQEIGIKSKKIGGHTVICLEYLSQSLEADLYDLFFLLVHEDKMIYGTFSCLREDAPEMSIVFLACLDTLQFIKN